MKPKITVLSQLCAFLCFAVMAAGVLLAYAKPSYAVSWPNQGRACLPVEGRMFPSFNWSNGQSFGPNNMPACHCPPKSYCPEGLSEWADHPRMPARQAPVCCPAPRVCDVNITNTGCGVPNSNVRTINSFCYNFTAVPVEPQNIPLRRGEPGTGPSEAYSYAHTCRSAHINENDRLAAECLGTKSASEWIRSTIDNVSECVGISNNNGTLECARNNNEKDLRERAARELNSCMRSCKDRTDQLHGRDANNPNNLLLMNQIGACEQNCRLSAAELFGARSGNRINGQIPGFTTTTFTDIPNPSAAVTLLESKVSCGRQEDIGYCETNINQSCDGDGDGDGSGDGGDGGGDCLAVGSLITLADGSTKPIEQIVAGDQVKGYNSINTVTGTTRNFTITEVIYAVNDSTLQITEGHPILTKDGWKAVNPALIKSDFKDKVAKLEVGDVLLRSEGEPITVTSLTALKSDATTDRHNLSVDGDGTFIANGLILRGFNLSIQY